MAANKNGRGRAPQRPQPKKRKAGKKGAFLWAVTAVATLISAVISIVTRISDRKLALAAVREDEQLSLLYFGEKKTEKE